MKLLSALLRPRILLPALAFLAVAYLALSFAMVWSATRAERFPFEATPDEYGVAYEEVSFPSRGHELQLSGWLLRGDRNAPYLIFVHGLGGQRTSDGAIELAGRLVKDGYNVLLFDLRAHGTSPGSVVSGGYYERDDVLGAYDYVLSLGAQPGRVALIGRSMGAGTSIMAAASEPGVGAVVADSAFASVDDLVAHETASKTPFPRAVVPVFLPGAGLVAKAVYGIDLGDLHPEDDVRSLRYPVLLIHGQADQRIPEGHTWRIYQNAPAGSEIWTLPGVDHVDMYRSAPDEYFERVEAYLESRLEEAQRIAGRTRRPSRLV